MLTDHFSPLLDGRITARIGRIVKQRAESVGARSEARAVALRATFRRPQSEGQKSQRLRSSAGCGGTCGKGAVADYASRANRPDVRIEAWLVGRRRWMSMAAAPRIYWEGGGRPATGDPK